MQTQSDLDRSITPPNWQRGVPSLLVALGSFAQVLRDPNQTGHGARVVLLIDRHTNNAAYQRFRQSPNGRRILAGEPCLFERLTDRKSLGATRPESLARRYLAFMEEEGISTEALHAEVAPIEAEINGPDLSRARFHRHMRASHDLWHVLTGYHRDLLGELQLIAFSQRQTGSRAFAWLSKLTRYGIERRISEARELLELARARSHRAPWLLAVDWEPLLRAPIDEVRDRLLLGPAPRYTQYVRGETFMSLVPAEASTARARIDER